MTLYTEHLVKTLCNADYRHELSAETLAYLETELESVLPTNCLDCIFVHKCLMHHKGDCAFA